MLYIDTIKDRKYRVNPQSRRLISDITPRQSDSQTIQFRCAVTRRNRKSVPMELRPNRRVGK